MVEVDRLDLLGRPAGREDRRLVADVGEVGPRQAARLAGDQAEVDRIDVLVAGVDLEDQLAVADVRRGDVDLAVEAARAQQRRVELVEQVGRRDHDDPAGRVEAVHLDQQLVERLVLLAGDVHPPLAADGVELVDEDDRRLVLAGDPKQPADAGGAEAGEHLDERRGRLGVEAGARLVGDGLRQQRLAGAGRSVEQHAAGNAGAELGEAAGIAQELDDLLELGLGVLDAGDVGPADGHVGGRLDLLRLGLRHQRHRLRRSGRPSRP